MAFERIGNGQWREVPTLPAKPGAKWTPLPTDSRGAWGDYEFAITSFAGGMMGGLEIDLIYRYKTDVVWSSVGAGDGVVFESSEPYEALSFATVWSQTQAEVNIRLAAKCAELRSGVAPIQIIAPIPASAPPTFSAFQSWMHDSVVWSGQVAPPGPTPTPSAVFPLYVNRVFAGKHAFEYGVNADGTPAVRVNEWGKGWEDYVPK